MDLGNPWLLLGRGRAGLSQLLSRNPVCQQTRQQLSPGIHKTLPHPLLPLPPPWVSDGVLTLHTPSVVGTQDGVGAPWHCPGDAGCVQGERDMGLLRSWKEGEWGSWKEGNASSSAVTLSKVLQETLPQVCLL